MGDGATGDFDATIKAHAAANIARLKVCANAGTIYYIGGASKTATIQIETDWGYAKFIIDNTKIESRTSHVLNISSRLPPQCR